MSPRPRRRTRPGARVDVFQAIADPTRRRLLDALERSDQPVNRLAGPVRMSRPAISQHLRVLRRAGLVKVRRAGREGHYCLRGERLRQVYDWVAHYERFWTQKLAALGRYLEESP